MGVILRKQLLFMLGVTIAFLSNFSTALAYERAVKNLTTTIANDIRGMGKHTIAVVDFTDLRGNVTELGRFIAEEISIDLAMSATGFRVLDRAHMKSILEELALSSSELFDLQKASEVGKLSGADAIVAGSVIPFGDNVRITVKVIATETGRVISAAKEYIAKTRAIEKMLNASIVSDPPTKQPEHESPDKKPQTDATWNFETGDLQGWESKGDAFLHQPTYGDNPTARNRGQPSAHQGEYWIGGFEKRPRPFDPPGQIQGDGPQGTLTSLPFIITRPVISFLVGGGCDISRVRIDLIVDRRVVRSATGKCHETMKRKRWEVSKLIGKRGRIQLVDESSGGWGHINFDDLRFEGE